MVKLGVFLNDQPWGLVQIVFFSSMKCIVFGVTNVSARIKMIVIVAVLVTSVTPVSASLIFGGNTQEIGDPTLPGGPPSVSGTVNFAVFNRSSPGVDDTWGTGLMDTDGAGPIVGFDSAAFTAGFLSGALDTSAAYLYVYQVVNDGPSAVEISAISQFIGPTSETATSW